MRIITLLHTIRTNEGEILMTLTTKNWNAENADQHHSVQVRFTCKEAEECRGKK